MSNPCYVASLLGALPVKLLIAQDSSGRTRLSPALTQSLAFFVCVELKICRALHIDAEPGSDQRAQISQFQQRSMRFALVKAPIASPTHR